jgi:hypothetical protein
MAFGMDDDERGTIVRWELICSEADKSGRIGSEL